MPNAYWLHHVTFDRTPLSRSSSSTARTTRKPTQSASVIHQMLCGLCGSRLSQVLSEKRRMALRHFSASSFHEPPRSTFGYRSSVGILMGSTNGLSLGSVL